MRADVVALFNNHPTFSFILYFFSLHHVWVCLNETSWVIYIDNSKTTFACLQCSVTLAKSQLEAIASKEGLKGGGQPSILGNKNILIECVFFTLKFYDLLTPPPPHMLVILYL